MRLTELSRLISVSNGREGDSIYMEELKPLLLDYFIMIMKQNYERYKRVDESLVQTITIPLEQIFDGVDNTFLRTVKQLPDPVNFNTRKEPFFSVTNAILSTNRRKISYLEHHEVENIQYRRFTKNSLYYSLEQKYVYLHNDKSLDKVTIRHIFRNPFTVMDFAKENKYDVECKCFEEDDFLIPSEYTGMIISFFGNGRRKTSEEKNEDEK